MSMRMLLGMRHVGELKSLKCLCSPAGIRVVLSLQLRSFSAHTHELRPGTILRYPHLGRRQLVDDNEGVDGFKVAVLGASGSMGRQISKTLVAARRDFPGLGPMTVQFVGTRDKHSLALMMGMCSELRDAYQEFCPHLEVVTDVEKVKADVLVMAAGALLSDKYKTHNDLVSANAELFGYYASMLVKKNRKSMVLVVSNPVEFGVDTFLDAGFSPRRVLGVGAYLDSMRFRREVASELGVPRQHISGVVLGVHGLGMVPCWSTVHLSVLASLEKKKKLDELKAEGLSRMPKDVEAVRALAYEIRAFAEQGDAMTATALIMKQPADIRATVRRYLSFFSGPHYPRLGVAEAVRRLIGDILNGSEIISSAQVRLDSGEFLGIKSVAIGAPVVISGRGVRYSPLELLPVEQNAVLNCAKEIEALSLNAEAKAMFHIIKRRGQSGTQHKH